MNHKWQFQDFPTCVSKASSRRGAGHTTLGLKGGSTSLLSKAGQSIILKKGCKRMSPTTPSLRVGSLSKNCRKSESIHWGNLLHLNVFSSKNDALCWVFYRRHAPSRSGLWPPCWSSEGNGEYPCGWTQTTHLHRLRGRATDQLAFHTAALQKTTSQRRRSTSVPAGSEWKNTVIVGDDPDAQVQPGCLKMRLLQN